MGDFNVSIFFSKASGKEQICPPVVHLSFLTECHFFVMHCHSGKGPAFDILVTGVYTFTTKLQLFSSSTFGRFGLDLYLKVKDNLKISGWLIIIVHYLQVQDLYESS